MAPALAPRIRRKSSKNGDWGVKRQQATAPPGRGADAAQQTLRSVAGGIAVRDSGPLVECFHHSLQGDLPV
jgi:hypothetical protein